VPSEQTTIQNGDVLANNEALSSIPYLLFPALLKIEGVALGSGSGSRPQNKIDFSNFDSGNGQQQPLPLDNLPEE